MSTWSSDSDLVLINTYLSCGSYAFTWHQSKDGGTAEALDTTVFTVDDMNRTINVQTNDVSKVGSYVISYQVSLVSHSSVAAVTQSNAFMYTIDEVCSTATVTIPG